MKLTTKTSQTQTRSIGKLSLALAITAGALIGSLGIGATQASAAVRGADRAEAVTVRCDLSDLSDIGGIKDIVKPPPGHTFHCWK